MVGVNDVAISTPETPFGGYKTSGIGKEGSRCVGWCGDEKHFEAVIIC